MISVKRVIDDYNLINSTDIIGCAVSGGSDSMALLHFLMCVKAEYGFKLVCVNIDHGIRGEESRRDSMFVKEYCLKNNIPLLFKKADALQYCKQNKLNLEEAARIIRHNYFYGLIEDKQCSKIFIAHNKNDNAETVLLNIFRGSGTKGICGMEIDNGRGLFRPMLNTQKQEIIDYIQKNDIPYITDSTNKDNAYNRNYIRNILLPLILERFGGAYENIANLSNIVKKEDIFLDAAAKEFISNGGNGYYIKLPCDDVLLSRAAYICCKKYNLSDIQSVNIDDIVRLKGKRNGCVANIGGGINAYKEYGRIFIGRQTEKNDIIIPFKSGSVTIGDYIITSERVKQKKDINFKEPDTFYVDGDSIDNSCVYRFKKRGDVFKRFSGGTKTLSDFFTDIKMPKRKRDSLPLLACGGKVLIVFPIDIGDGVKITDNTKIIYKFFYRRIT